MLSLKQEGFLDDQSQPASKGDRGLKYDRDGMFLLFTKSYATIRCEMDFQPYPFDTQKCMFVLLTAQNLSYQVYH